MEKLNLLYNEKKSYVSVLKNVKSYLETAAGKFTFAGALRSTGYCYTDYNSLVKRHLEGKTLTADELKILRLFEELKLMIGEFCEEQVLYQKALGYNHSQAQWMLKKLNPEMYGDKVAAINSTGSKTRFKLDELVNESGVSITDVKIS